MTAQRQRDTEPEIAIRRLLHSRGLRYRTDYRVEGQRCKIDIAFTRLKIAAFIDGCFWHGCPIHASWPKSNAAWWREKLRGNVERDERVGNWLRENGWAVVRVWEHEDPFEGALRIYRAIGRRQRGET